MIAKPKRKEGGVTTPKLKEPQPQPTAERQTKRPEKPTRAQENAGSRCRGLELEVGSDEEEGTEEIEMEAPPSEDLTGQTSMHVESGIEGIQKGNNIGNASDTLHEPSSPDTSETSNAPKEKKSENDAPPSAPQQSRPQLVKVRIQQVNHLHKELASNAGRTGGNLPIADSRTPAHLNHPVHKKGGGHGPNQGHGPPENNHTNQKNGSTGKGAQHGKE
ncbi:unnamed protein product [Linum trigynum]|uniref:Uncharacterized protein n=1 Tax=Linum trigynum TaxID=586398 RepID=A0AAV2EQ60_9ROSI